MDTRKPDETKTMPSPDERLAAALTISEASLAASMLSRERYPANASVGFETGSPPEDRCRQRQEYHRIMTEWFGEQLKGRSSAAPTVP